MERNGITPAMARLMEQVRACMEEKNRYDLYKMFVNCFTNTLNTTVKRQPNNTTFVITGDIPAMWLRDSACQLRPYLLLAEEDEWIKKVLKGLVRSQFSLLLSDPYANAFNALADGSCYRKDETAMGPGVWERKFEVDSLCYPLDFAYLLWKNTGDTDHLDAVFKRGAERILFTFLTEQYHEERSSYRFVRRDTYYTETLSREGKGALVKSGTGMIWSGFRPSDDACAYGYLIPSNMFAVTALKELAEMAEQVLKDRELAGKARRLAEEIYEGIESFGITDTEEFGRVYAYETDGFGQYNLMDDANVPSLLSMPYLRYEPKDMQIYRNTRRRILSDANPCFYKGAKAKGVGSFHTPSGYVWPIALAMEGLTDPDRENKWNLLKLLKATDGGTGLMHEGFQADDPSKYTREWFSWANAMFCELMLDYCGFQIKK